LEKLQTLFAELGRVRAAGGEIGRQEFLYALEKYARTKENLAAGSGLEGLYGERIQCSPRKPPVIPKTEGQRDYLRAIEAHDITFGLGPAGTGKTYLAVAKAVAALKAEKVNKIILTRPAVEAGEALGFLPGELQEKILPYLRPLYDALHDMMEQEEIQRAIERNIIEIAPLAYMRGRTLNKAFIILDEAQNTTTEQMFMFLTRIGIGSKCVVTGDVTQIDLPRNKPSGLVEAIGALRETPAIAFHHFGEQDVVRHPLVRAIITAYKEHRGLRESRF
jgi:phosphate starvation-inducible PhoH-like protein